MEDVLEWLEEYEAKWSPASKIHEIVVEELMYFIETNDEIYFNILSNGYLENNNTQKTKKIVSNGGITYSIEPFEIADMSKGGIYQIRNLINNKIYVGSTIVFRKRWREHRNGLNGEYHGNDYLQNSWNLHGDNNFTLDIIEYVADSNSLFERERYWLEKLNVTNDSIGYNIYPYPIGYMAGHYPEETRKKISRSNSGEKNGRAILSAKEVWEIKMLLHYTKLRVGEIAEHFCVSTSAINDIKKGIRWIIIEIDKKDPFPEHLQKVYNEINEFSVRQKLTRNQVKEIKIIIRDTDLLNTEIAEIFNIGATTISNIRTGETWSEVSITEDDIFSKELKMYITSHPSRRKTPVYLDN